MHNEMLRLEEGVFFTRSNNKLEILQELGENYSCFMNHFFISRDTTELTEAQVFSICSIREKYPEIIGSINEKVKDVFKLFIQTGGFQDVLEIGCGSNPTFTTEDKSFNFTASDANEYVVSNTREKGIRSIVFGCSNTDEIECNYDVAFAVFVLHFYFSDKEILSLKDHLKPEGIFIANVYRLPENRRIEVKERFKDLGFEIKRLKDTKVLCKDHEYWIMSLSKVSITRYSQLLSRLLCS